MKDKPLVSISCITYNHAPYIRQCLEGFVMQKTNFAYEILIHDDASTDGTSEIIREYEKKYPDLIKPLYETENQWKKGRRGSLFFNIPRAMGKYIAICEGDDYWTDPLKLQKQVDFLESHPEYSLCFHRVKCLMQSTGEMVDEYLVGDMPGESSIEDLAKGNYIHTPSVMYRANDAVYVNRKILGTCSPGDYVLWMLYAEIGKIWKMEEPMAVYRVGSGMWSTSHSIKNDMMYLCTLNKLYAVIENPEAKKNLQKQIDFIVKYVVELDRSYNQVKQSKAYKLGKIFLKPFKWFRKTRVESGESRE